MVYTTWPQSGDWHKPHLLVKTPRRRGPASSVAPAGVGQVADEAVAVAPVDRMHVLDDLALVRARGARSKRNAGECSGRRARLIRPRSSPSARSPDSRRPRRSRTGPPAARRTSAPRRSAAVRPGTRRLRDMEGLHRHRLAVRVAEPSHDDDRLRRRDMQQPAETRAGRNAPGRRCGSRAPSRGAHVLREGRHVSSWAIFGSLTKVPGATAAHEDTLADEVVERGAHRQARDAEVDADWRSEGIASPILRRSIRSRTRSLASPCFVMRRPPRRSALPPLRRAGSAPSPGRRSGT